MSATIDMGLARAAAAEVVRRAREAARAMRFELARRMARGEKLEPEDVIAACPTTEDLAELEQDARKIVELRKLVALSADVEHLRAAEAEAREVAERRRAELDAEIARLKAERGEVGRATLEASQKLAAAEEAERRITKYLPAPLLERREAARAALDTAGGRVSAAKRALREHDAAPAKLKEEIGRVKKKLGGPLSVLFGDDTGLQESGKSRLQARLAELEEELAGVTGKQGRAKERELKAELKAAQDDRVVAQRVVEQVEAAVRQV